MNQVPVCNEAIVRKLLVSMPPEPSKNSDGSQRMNRYTNYPEWNIHLVVRGFRGPETMTVGVSAPTSPEFGAGQVPVFANLVARQWSKLHGDRPSAGMMVSADGVVFVDPAEFVERVAAQREREARDDQAANNPAAEAA